jgi:hypothetical protein
MQFSHKPALAQYDVEALLRALFEKAKAKDEFEFCCTLLRLRGLEGPGWDPQKESFTLINQTLALIQAPLEQSIRLRLMLFLYCHVTEMYDLYHIVGNLLRVCAGERYCLDCFLGIHHPSGKNAVYPASKVERIKQWAIDQGLPDLGEMFCDLLVKEVRNAFFHSDYIIHDKYFHIRRGDGVKIGNVIDPRVELSWLTPRIELGINVALMLIQLVMEAVQSYTANKIVMGRFQGDRAIPIELTAQPGFGLIGFRSPPQRTP